MHLAPVALRYSLHSFIENITKITRKIKNFEFQNLFLEMRLDSRQDTEIDI
jgi:hypothetical protein